MLLQMKKGFRSVAARWSPRARNFRIASSGAGNFGRYPDFPRYLRSLSDNKIMNSDLYGRHRRQQIADAPGTLRFKKKGLTLNIAKLGLHRIRLVNRI